MKTFLLISLLLIITGCSESQSAMELQKFFAEIKQSSSADIAPLPELRFIRQTSYQLNKFADPFQQKIKPGATSDRPREPLEMFPLNALRVMGTIISEHKMWVLIAAPNGLLYKVTQGAYLGQNEGKISAITSRELQIEEKSSINAVCRVGKLKG